MPMLPRRLVGPRTSIGIDGTLVARSKARQEAIQTGSLLTKHETSNQSSTSLPLLEQESELLLTDPFEIENVISFDDFAGMDESAHTIMSAGLYNTVDATMEELLLEERFPDCDQIPSTHNMVLHEACTLFSSNPSVVEAALLSCPEDISKRYSVPAQDFSLPLHLALHHSACHAVVKLLVEANPSVLLQKDGSQGITPLVTALRTSPQDTALHQYLVRAQPDATTMISNLTQDYPLHVACQFGCSLDTVQTLIRSFPLALYVPNGRGQKPLDIVLAGDSCNHSTDLPSALRMQFAQMLQHAMEKYGAQLPQKTYGGGGHDHSLEAIIHDVMAAYM